MSMHIREQIKTKPLIVSNIDDNPIPRNIVKKAVTQVDTFPTVPADSTTSINIFSISVPLNCLGTAFTIGVLDNKTDIRLLLVSSKVWFQILTDNMSLMLLEDTFSCAVKLSYTVKFQLVIFTISIVVLNWFLFSMSFTTKSSRFLCKVWGLPK